MPKAIPERKKRKPPPASNRVVSKQPRDHNPNLPDGWDVRDALTHPTKSGKRSSEKILVARLKKLLAMLKPAKDEWDFTAPTESRAGTLITQKLSDVSPEEIVWLWKNRLALKKLNIIYGDPGVGKTWLVLDIIAHVTTGSPFCDGAECPSGEVLFVTGEDGIGDTIRPRLDSLQADVDRVHSLEFTDRQGKRSAFRLDKDLSVLDAWLKDHPGVRIMVLDPLSAFLGDTNAHVNSEVRGVLVEFAKIADTRNVAIIGIDHLNKGDAKAIYRGSGSIAFTAAPRAVWQVIADEEDLGRDG